MDNKNLNLKLVSIGSIAAASLLINAFSDQKERLTAIVPTTDTGSSTGIIRKKFSMPAPGDVRAVLSAMAAGGAEREILKELFEYRLKPEHVPELPNLALGNLILAALTEMMGSYGKAVKTAGEILGVKGQVLPVTTVNAHIKATLDDGTERVGEAEVRRTGKAAIRDLVLESNAALSAEGVAEAITGADMVVIGPGCFYTSIIACLVVPGLTDCLRRTEAIKIYCCNTTVTPGQTDGFSVFDHVRVITRYLDNVPPDYALINTMRPQPEVEAAYSADGIHPLLPSPRDADAIKELGCIPVLSGLIEENWSGKRTLHKLDTIRHDPRKVKDALMTIIMGKS